MTSSLASPRGIVMVHPPLLHRAFQKLDSLQISPTAVHGDTVIPQDVIAGRDP